jgi:hypothetical protein
MKISQSDGLEAARIIRLGRRLRPPGEMTFRGKGQGYVVV